MRWLGLVPLVLVFACGRGALLPGPDAGTTGGSGGGHASGGGGGNTGGGSGGGGGAIDAGTSCSGLGVEACRLDAACEPDFCRACSCQPNFKGCRAKTDAPFDCPALGCPSPVCCQASAECQAIGTCAPPGTPFGCGACNNQPDTCTDDASCPADAVCDPRPCACSGQRDCRPGCGVNNPCAAGTTCTAKRCVPLACTSSATCPGTFACLNGQCARRTCTTDLQCGDGFCVDGTCFEGLGECRTPMP